MNLIELKNSIISNINEFEQLLRDNFDFTNVRILHDNVVDYNTMVIIVDFISLELHDCAEIEDFIFISFEADGENKEYDWQGTTIYMSQWINEMD